MRQQMPYPAYFCPEGVELPQHLGWKRHASPTQIVANGPNGGAGMHWAGGIYDARSAPRWKKAKAGWYILLEEHHVPTCFARVKIHEKGRLVIGAKEGHVWLIPELLQWHPELILASAVDSVLKDDMWQPPAHLIPLIDRLRALALYGINGTGSVVGDRDFVQLAVDVLGLNYDIGYDELSLAGWLTESMTTRILEIATGLAGLNDMVLKAKAAKA